MPNGVVHLSFVFRLHFIWHRLTNWLRFVIVGFHKFNPTYRAFVRNHRKKICAAFGSCIAGIASFIVAVYA